MQKITTFLWFDDNAEQAVELYTSLFKRAKILAVSRYGDAGPGPKGQVMLIHFQLEGQDFMALNGGPDHKFTEAISLSVSCETQAEIDRYVELLTADGGELGFCGWVKDRFGLWWQIVPSTIGELVGGKDSEKSQRAMKAMMQMRKLDLAALQRAYDGR